MSNLTDINGIGPKYADLLNEIGINSIEKLARQEPEKILEEINEHQRNNRSDSNSKRPTIAQVEEWIAEANTTFKPKRNLIKLYERAKAARQRIFLLAIILLILLFYFYLLRAGYNLVTTSAHYRLYGTESPISFEWKFLIGSLMTLTFILITLPAWMIFFYVFARYETIKAQVNHDLEQCGTPTTLLNRKMEEFAERSNFTALIWPTIIALVFLFLGWSLVLGPRGITGAREAVTLGGRQDIEIASFVITRDPESRAIESIERVVQSTFTTKTFDADAFLNYIARNSLAITWIFLGTYFYYLSALMRRWLLSDLVSGFLWRMNIRFAIVFIMGILANRLLPEVPPFLLFMAGILPDTFFRWLTDITKRLAGIGNNSNDDFSRSVSRVFGPSDLQSKIDGLSFWQADRLYDEGIENVQNLATEEIPDLLVSVRFDTPRLMDWIDQAILHKHAPHHVEILKMIGIQTASDLLDCVTVENGENQETDCHALAEAIQDFHGGIPANYKILSQYEICGKEVLVQLIECIAKASQSDLVQAQNALLGLHELLEDKSVVEVTEELHTAVSQLNLVKVQTQTLNEETNKISQAINTLPADTIADVLPALHACLAQGNSLQTQLDSIMNLVNTAVPPEADLAQAETTTAVKANLQAIDQQLETAVKTSEEFIASWQKAQDQMKTAVRQLETKRLAASLEISPAPLTAPILKNIVTAIENGPNIKYIRRYWENAGPEQRSEAVAAQT